jgi:methylated-DNA-[protein]-cysteine S-methyltransferase
MTVRHAVTDTILGPVTIAANGDVVAGVYFEHCSRRPEAANLRVRVSAAQDRPLRDVARQIGAERKHDLHPLKQPSGAAASARF